MSGDDIDMLSRWAIRFVWSLWIIAVMVSGILLGITTLLGGLCMGSCHMIIIGTGELPVVALLLGGMPIQRNPIYKSSLRLTSGSARVALGDFIALVGFGTFNVFGAIATFGSRNSLAFIADAALGVAFLLMYLLRRSTIRSYLLKK